MRPVHDRVVILPDEKEERTAGGIILPDSQKEKQAAGIIIAVGQDKEGNQLPVSEGARVLFNKYAGTEFEEGGQIYKVLRIDDVYCVTREQTVNEVSWVSNY